MPKIEHERRIAILEQVGEALNAADDRAGEQPGAERNEQTGWFSDELCDAHNVIHNLLGEWLREAEEYLDQRADVDDDRPNAAMRLLTDLRKCFEASVPTVQKTGNE
jgi:hypothetical protein